MLPVNKTPSLMLETWFQTKQKRFTNTSKEGKPGMQVGRTGCVPACSGNDNDRHIRNPARKAGELPRLGALYER